MILAFEAFPRSLLCTPDTDALCGRACEAQARMDDEGDRPGVSVGSLADKTVGEAYTVVASASTAAACGGRLGSAEQLWGQGSEQTVKDDVMQEIPIRGVQPRDVQGILALAQRTGVFTSEEVAVVRELVEAELNDPQQRDYHSLTAEADGQVVGFACYGPASMTEGTFDLYWIFVDPSYQRHSIGRALLSAVERAIRLAGGRMLLVDTSSTEPYSAARRFYQRQGFREAAEVRDYYRPGDSRLTYMKLVSA